jgi:hypothetical protein
MVTKILYKTLHRNLEIEQHEPIKSVCELMCSVRACSFCSTCGTCRVTLVTITILYHLLTQRNLFCCLILQIWKWFYIETNWLLYNKPISYLCFKTDLHLNLSYLRFSCIRPISRVVMEKKTILIPIEGPFL